MHAECRYICNHHPCLPVKMLRNYKERSPRQTKEKKNNLSSGRESYDHPTLFKVNCTPILDYIQWNWVQTAVPGLFSSYVNPRSMHISARARLIPNGCKHHNQIQLLSFFFQKGKYRFLCSYLLNTLLPIDVYDLLEFHPIICPCGTEGSFEMG